MRGCSPAQQQQRDSSHGLPVAPGNPARHEPGHGRRRGGTGSPAPQPTEEREHFNHCAPSDVPLLMEENPCAAVTQHRAAQGPPCPRSLSPREQEALVYLLAPHQAI